MRSNTNQKKEAFVAFATGTLVGGAMTVLFMHRFPPWTLRPIPKFKRYVRSSDFVPHFMFATFFWLGVTIREQQVRRKAAKERRELGRF